MSAELRSPAPAERRPSRPGRYVSRVVVLIAGALVLLGLAGLDQWFYEHVSCVLNTMEHRPLDRCFYSVTQPFWLACRLVFGHVIGGAVIYGLIVVLHPHRWTAATAGLVAVVVAATLANVAQRAIGRLRPNRAESHLTFTQPAHALFRRAPVSFPSGEAATAFALASALSRLFARWRTPAVAGRNAQTQRAVHRPAAEDRAGVSDGTGDPRDRGQRRHPFQPANAVGIGESGARAAALPAAALPGVESDRASGSTCTPR